ncbi:MAG: hypothetical protein Q4C73_02185 [Eubacteriales bacterium]|nr:hypothetical protein [Eubacteriales bacterium]
MNTNTPKNTTIYDRFATLSLTAGAFGLLACCFGPPAQFACGCAAVILAWGSRNGQPLRGSAKAGFVLGIISAVSGIIFFIQYVWLINMIQDPANAGLVKELYRQTQDIMNQLIPSQPAG